MNLLKTVNRCLNLVFPPVCPLCGLPLGSPLDPIDWVCASCRSGLTCLSPPFCLTCGVELISKNDYCRRCADKKFSFDKGFSLYSYRDSPRELLYQYKMAGNRVLSCFYARELMRQYFADGEKFPVVPVPPGRRNLRARGWDPVGLILRQLHNLYGLERLEILYRLPSESQKKLNRRDRLSNMKGKIKVRRGAAVPPRVYLLDDVWTTGATLEECSRVLKERGAEEVIAVTLVKD